MKKQVKFIQKLSTMIQANQILDPNKQRNE